MYPLNLACLMFGKVIGQEVAAVRPFLPARRELLYISPDVLHCSVWVVQIESLVAF